MADDSLITEELRNKIGIESEPEVHDIEKGVIQQFVRAIDDPNPLWHTVAPPTLIPVIGRGESQSIFPSIHADVTLHGSTELECYQPVRPGDTITITSKLADIRERQGTSTKKTAFVTMERTYKNQRQELVAKCRQMVIFYNL